MPDDSVFLRNQQQRLADLRARKDSLSTVMACDCLEKIGRLLDSSLKFEWYYDGSILEIRIRPTKEA